MEHLHFIDAGKLTLYDTHIFYRDGAVMIKSSTTKRNVLLLALLLIGTFPALAGDWTQFRGPLRDGISLETGLLQEWPEGGPSLLWRANGLGKGFSSPIIVGETIYITGDVKDDLCIFAFDLAGKDKWRVKNGAAWKKSYPGARSSITSDDGNLYHLNSHGRLACLDARDGREVWAVDTFKEFGGKSITWGISECLLVDGEQVFVTPGGERTLMVALNKRTSKVIWESGPLKFIQTVGLGGRALDTPKTVADKTGYASPILIETGGRRLLASCSARHFYLVDAQDGKIVWCKKVPARYEVIGAIPVKIGGNRLLFTAPDVAGGECFQINASGESLEVKSLWRTDLDNCHGALVVVGDRIYGSGYKRYTPWVSLDAATGKTLLEKTDQTIGSSLWADGHLYGLAEDGTMMLLKPGAEQFDLKGQFMVSDQSHRRDIWAHPVVHNKRLYLRDHDTLFCYDIAR